MNFKTTVKLRLQKNAAVVFKFKTIYVPWTKEMLYRCVLGLRMDSVRKEWGGSNPMFSNYSQSQPLFGAQLFSLL